MQKSPLWKQNLFLPINTQFSLQKKITHLWAPHNKLRQFPDLLSSDNHPNHFFYWSAFPPPHFMGNNGNGGDLNNFHLLRGHFPRKNLQPLLIWVQGHKGSFNPFHEIQRSFQKGQSIYQNPGRWGLMKVPQNHFWDFFYYLTEKICLEVVLCEPFQRGQNGWFLQTTEKFLEKSA